MSTIKSEFDIISKPQKALVVLFTCMALILPSIGQAGSVEEKPSALAMTGDLLLARPLLTLFTIGGIIMYIPSAPFALAGGNEKHVRQTLIVKPGKAAFVRCLGCTKSGYNKSID